MTGQVTDDLNLWKVFISVNDPDDHALIDEIVASLTVAIDSKEI